MSDFKAEAHSGFFEVGAKGAVDQSDCGKILHARESGCVDLAQKPASSHETGRCRTPPARTGVCETTGNTSCAISRTMPLASPYGMSPASERAPPCEARARVVNHQEVDAAGFGELGAQSGARAAADDRLPCGDLRTQPRENVFTLETRPCLSLDWLFVALQVTDCPRGCLDRGAGNRGSIFSKAMT